MSHDQIWQSGEHCAVRGIYQDRVVYAQSVIVVHDRPAEVALLLMPGAECSHPDGWRFGAHGTGAALKRWSELRAGSWTLAPRRWDTNRFLVLLEPEKYYASGLIWEHESDVFDCYYINFQLPFRRSHCGLDSLDLELDLIATPDGDWHWKDADDYEEGIHKGGMIPEWVKGVDCGQSEVLQRLNHRAYPFDGTWLDWMPDRCWLPPELPKAWRRL
jgi:hypothetical protein